jgi:hypothetical protein
MGHLLWTIQIRAGCYKYIYVHTIGVLDWIQSTLFVNLNGRMMCLLTSRHHRNISSDFTISIACWLSLSNVLKGIRLHACNYRVECMYMWASTTMYHVRISVFGKKQANKNNYPVGIRCLYVCFGMAHTSYIMQLRIDCKIKGLN